MFFVGWLGCEMYGAGQGVAVDDERQGPSGEDVSFAGCVVKGRRRGCLPLTNS
jgi:hypothetical protein